MTGQAGREQRQADRLRQHVPGALHLLGDRASGLEAHEGEADEGHDGEERPEQPAAAVRGARAAEQERERLRAVEEQQRDADAERGDQLRCHRDVEQPAQELAADHVGEGPEQQDPQRQEAGLRLAERVEADGGAEELRRGQRDGGQGDRRAAGCMPSS